MPRLATRSAGSLRRGLSPAFSIQSSNPGVAAPSPLSADSHVGNAAAPPSAPCRTSDDAVRREAALQRVCFSDQHPVRALDYEGLLTEGTRIEPENGFVRGGSRPESVQCGIGLGPHHSPTVARMRQPRVLKPPAVMVDVIELLRCEHGAGEGLQSETGGISTGAECGLTVIPSAATISRNRSYL